MLETPFLTILIIVAELYIYYLENLKEFHIYNLPINNENIFIFCNSLTFPLKHVAFRLLLSVSFLLDVELLMHLKFL